MARQNINRVAFLAALSTDAHRPTAARPVPYTGDPGDYDDDDSIEVGDPDDDGDEDGPEQGRARGRGKKRLGRVASAIFAPGRNVRQRRQAQARARRPAAAPIVARAASLERISDAARQKADPRFMADLAAKKALQKATAPDVLYERYSGVDNRVSGELPPDARLRASEVSAISTATFLNPTFAPQSFNFPVVGLNFELVINSTLAPLLPVGTEWTWLGDILRISSSVLNANPVTFTVTRTLGGVATQYVYTIPAMTNLSGITAFNGRLIAAVPRLSAQQVTVDPVPDLANQITISGLNTTFYSVSARFFIPGDSEVEGLLRKLR